MAKMTSLANATGNFPTGRDYQPQTVSNVVNGLSFDTVPNAPTVSYEEDLEARRKAEEEEEKRRESRRMTDLAVSVALMGAIGACG